MQQLKDVHKIAVFQFVLQKNKGFEMLVLEQKGLFIREWAFLVTCNDLKIDLLFVNNNLD